MQRTPRHSHNPSRGFSLAEMLVVIAITSTVGLAMGEMITYFYRSNAYLLESTSAIDSAHRGLDIAFNNLREASYGDDGSYPVGSAATSTITFYSDVDNDGPVEKVRIYYTGGKLYRGVTNSAGNPPSYTGQSETTYTIASSVVNSTSTPVFRYYDSDGDELTGTVDVSQVASVSTSVMVDLNPNRAPDILTLGATATLRNLRSE